MGGTKGPIYSPLGRKGEEKVDMDQVNNQGSYGKRAKLICGLALLAGMALLTHRIATGRSPAKGDKLKQEFVKMTINLN